MNTKDSPGLDYRLMFDTLLSTSFIGRDGDAKECPLYFSDYWKSTQQRASLQMGRVRRGARGRPRNVRNAAASTFGESSLGLYVFKGYPLVRHAMIWNAPWKLEVTDAESQSVTTHLPQLICISLPAVSSHRKTAEATLLTYSDHHSACFTLNIGSTQSVLVSALFSEADIVHNYSASFLLRLHV